MESLDSFGDLNYLLVKVAIRCPAFCVDEERDVYADCIMLAKRELHIYDAREVAPEMQERLVARAIEIRNALHQLEAQLAANGLPREELFLLLAKLGRAESTNGGWWDRTHRPKECPKTFRPITERGRDLIVKILLLWPPAPLGITVTNDADLAKMDLALSLRTGDCRAVLLAEKSPVSGRRAEPNLEDWERCRAIIRDHRRGLVRSALATKHRISYDTVKSVLALIDEEPTNDAAYIDGKEMARRLEALLQDDPKMPPKQVLAAYRRAYPDKALPDRNQLWNARRKVTGRRRGAAE